MVILCLWCHTSTAAVCPSTASHLSPLSLAPVCLSINLSNNFSTKPFLATGRVFIFFQPQSQAWISRMAKISGSKQMTWWSQPSQLLCLALSLNLWWPDCVNPLQSLQLLALSKVFKSWTRRWNFELQTYSARIFSKIPSSIIVIVIVASVWQSTQLSCAHPPRSIFQNAQSPPSYCHHHHQHHCQCHCHHHHKFSQPRVNLLVLFLIFSSKPTHHLKSVHFVQFSKLPDLIRLSLRHCANLNSCIGSLKTCSALLRSCSPRQQIFVVYWWSCSSGPTVIINVSAMQRSCNFNILEEPQQRVFACFVLQASQIRQLVFMCVRRVTVTSNKQVAKCFQWETLMSSYFASPFALCQPTNVSSILYLLGLLAFFIYFWKGHLCQILCARSREILISR